MRKTIDIRLIPEKAAEPKHILAEALRRVNWKETELQGWRLLKSSIDARKEVVFQLKVELFKDEDPPSPVLNRSKFLDVSESPAVHIIGAGPAGYFAALQCLEVGLKPVIFDRGKDVQSRRRDLRAIQQFGQVNPDSNYCFGEGGAGTYSDGKLYTRATKRGNAKKVLELLVEHGANEDILIDAHPHIGSNKLPGIISNIRSTIEHHGGEVHFGARLTDLVIEDGRLRAIRINDAEEIPVRQVILATGHSARDIFSLLEARTVAIEFKPFAIGVRIEHPQALIDSIQYHRQERGEHLPAASYSLACQVQGGSRGVFSFCMCPGGLVVPAATAPGEIVVNGMSLSRRDSAYANAGTVVSVDLKDIGTFREMGPAGGVAFQSSIERAVFDLGDGSQKAPALRLTDFVAGKVSADLPGSSYIPGIYPSSLDTVFPDWMLTSLREGIRTFGNRMRGYFTNEAIVIATESRTSAPIRIPRDPVHLMHPDIEGLFPCGEGAGYAGGIMSAAMDGQRVVDAIFQRVSR